MADDFVWVTNAHVDPRLIKGFESEQSLEEEYLHVNAIRRNKVGKPVSEDEFPKVMWAGPYDRRLKSTPHMFRASGFWVVSAQFADVLRRFDLTGTALYPVDLYRRDRKTPLGDGYAFLSCGAIKDGFEPAYSERFQDHPQAVEPHKTLPTAPKDFDISVNASVQTGGDIWFDRQLRYSFFFSDRLVQALKAEKLTSKLWLYKVGIVRNN